MYKYYSSNYTMHAQCINETTNVAIWNMNVDCVNKKMHFFNSFYAQFLSFHFTLFLIFLGKKIRKLLLETMFWYIKWIDEKKNSSWNAISENISLWTLNISLLTYRMEEDVSKLTLPTFFLGFFYSGINITDLKLCKTTHWTSASICVWSHPISNFMLKI